MSYGHAKWQSEAMRRVDQMESNPIVGGRRRPRKLVDETIKKDLDLNFFLLTWFTIGHSGVIWFM